MLCQLQLAQHDQQTEEKGVQAQHNTRHCNPWPCHVTRASDRVWDGRSERYSIVSGLACLVPGLNMPCGSA